LTCMESSFRASKTLYDYFGVFINKNAHYFGVF